MKRNLTTAAVALVAALASVPAFADNQQQAFEAWRQANAACSDAYYHHDRSASGFQRLNACEAAAEKEFADRKAAIDAAANAKYVHDHDCNRLGGVAVGMTAQQVRASCWGAPDRINETTFRSHVSQQWVFGSQFIYFENGRVIAISTSR